MAEKLYMVTDQCFYEEHGMKNPEDYNPDDRRKPHTTTVVDLETGTIRQVKSGSIVKIVQDAKK